MHSGPVQYTSTQHIFSGNKQKATDDVHRFELVYNLKYYF